MDEIKELKILSKMSDEEKDVYYAKQHKARMSALDAKIDELVINNIMKEKNVSYKEAKFILNKQYGIN